MLIEAAHVLAAIDAEILKTVGLHRARYSTFVSGMQAARKAVLEVIQAAEANVATLRKERRDE